MGRRLAPRENWRAIISTTVGSSHFPSIFFSASNAARCVACQGVRSHPVPVALVGQCSIPVV